MQFCAFSFEFSFSEHFSFSVIQTSDLAVGFEHLILSVLVLKLHVQYLSKISSTPLRVSIINKVPIIKLELTRKGYIVIIQLLPTKQNINI